MSDTPLQELMQAADKLSPDDQLALIDHLLTLATPVFEKPLPTDYPQLADFYEAQNQQMLGYVQANLTSVTREGIIEAVQFYNNALSALLMDFRHHLAVIRFNAQMWGYRDAEIVEFRFLGQSRLDLARKLVSRLQTSTERLDQAYSQVHSLWGAMSKWVPIPAPKSDD